MEEWDKLWNDENEEDFENCKLYSTAKIYLHIPQHLDSGMRDWLLKIKAEGDKLQRDSKFWQEACAEIQIYKDGLYDKLEKMRNLTEEMDYGDDVEEHWRKRILEVLNE